MTSIIFYGGVSEIDAKTLYPIYTEHPEAYKKISKEITLIKEGIKYEIK